MMAKPTRTITKYGEFDYRIEEIKEEKVVSTANIKVLEKEIGHLEEVKERTVKELADKKELLKELKKVK